MPSPLKKSFAAEQMRQRSRKKPGSVIILLIAVGVVAIGGFALYFRSGVKTPAPESEVITSIAVLPFDNLSDDREDEFFSDGVTDDIITYLSKIGGLKVISRTSSIQYKNTDKSLPEIGEELGVGAILEGTVRRSRNRVVVSVQLIDARNDAHLWAEKYDREMEDIFTIQEEISRTVVEELKIALSGEDKAALGKRPTDNIEAFDLYLLGRHHMNNDNLETALDYFGQAIEKDPDFALAYTGIAHVYNMWGYYSEVMPSRQAFPKAQEAIEKALEIDSNLAEAYTEMTWTRLYYDWDWPAAERSAQRALELNPNDMWAHHYYRDYHIIMGQWNEAIAEMQRCIELDPLNRRRILLALTYFLAERYDEAENLCRSLIEKNESDIFAYSILGRIYQTLGNYDDALELNVKTLELAEEEHDDTSTILMIKVYRAWYYAYSGERKKAEQILEELLRQRDEMVWPCCWIASIYASLGEMDTAFEWLEKAYENREAWLVYFKTFPEFEPFRSEPRGTAFLKKMGFE